MGFTDSVVACDVFCLPDSSISKEENSHPWNIRSCVPRIHAVLQKQDIIEAFFSSRNRCSSLLVSPGLVDPYKITCSSVPLSVPPPTHIQVLLLLLFLAEPHCLIWGKLGWNSWWKLAWVCRRRGGDWQFLITQEDLLWWKIRWLRILSSCSWWLNTEPQRRDTNRGFFPFPLSFCPFFFFTEHFTNLRVIIAQGPC